MPGTSYNYCKIEIINFLKDRFPLGSEILDVGAGSGTYRWYMGSGYNMDAVEVFKESAQILADQGIYRNVFNNDIRNFAYPQKYDLIIFGDILEHLSVEDAQAVLAVAQQYSNHILIGVPYMLPQEAIYGNEAEIHLQPDLTHQKFKERYPGFDLIIGRFDLYGYYYK